MALKSVGEKIQAHCKIATGATILLGFIAADLADVFIGNPTYSLPPKACVSLFKESNVYQNAGAITLLTTDTGIDTPGVLASGYLAHNAYGIQVAFRDPAKTSEWHTSGMLKANSTGHYAVKMAIGAGEVQFGIREVAHNDSSTCSETPQVSYEHASASSYFASGEELPWPNGVNNLTNLIHGLG